MAAASGLGPWQLGAHPRSRLGWEAEGGAAWDVQSDGRLLQLVQAAAGACQVGWSRLVRRRSRRWGQLRPEEPRGEPPHLSEPGRLSQAARDAFAPSLTCPWEGKLRGGNLLF